MKAKHDFETRPLERLLRRARSDAEQRAATEGKLVAHVMVVTAYCPEGSDGDDYDQAREDAEEAFECAGEALREMVADVRVEF